MSSDDPYISYTDQALLLARNASGHEPVMQLLWLYERAVDEEGLRRLHAELGRGLLGRRVARSPLPFGRHRWTTDPGVVAPLVVTRGGLPRKRLYEWADEQVDLPLDPEHGPAWRLSATALEDGAWAVSLVVSHCVADGGATAIALVSAAAGRAPAPVPVPAPRAGRTATIRGDLSRLRADLPEIGRALRAAVAGLRQGDDAGGASREPPPPPAVDALVPLPSVSVVVDQQEWEARARALGGNSLSLVAGLAARLGALADRQRDGVALLMVPVSTRGDSGTEGGNVVSVARAAIPVEGVTSDLAPARAELKRAISAARSAPDPLIHVLPLIPFIPGPLYARLADRMLGFNRDLPVSCSSMGDLDPRISQADGTPADHLLFRGVDRRVSAGSLTRRGGVLSLMSGTINGEFTLTVVGWQGGTLTTRDELHRLVQTALDEFAITGTLI